MNEKVKNIFKKVGVAIGSFFIALTSFIIFRKREELSDNGNRANDIREQVDRAGELNKSSREQVDSIKQSVDELRTSIKSERQNIKECQSIISDIRKRTTQE